MLAGKEIAVRHFVMNDEVLRQTSDIKKRILECAKNGTNTNVSNEEKFILNLKYRLKTHEKELGDELKKYYRLDKEEVNHLGWLTQEQHPQGILSKPCPICGYKYGNAWNYVPIPKEDEEIIFLLLGKDFGKEGEI